MCLNVASMSTIGAIKHFRVSIVAVSGVLPPSQSPMPSFASPSLYLPSFLSSPSRCSSSRVPSFVASKFKNVPLKVKRCDLFRVPSSTNNPRQKSMCVCRARYAAGSSRVLAYKVARARGRVRERFFSRVSSFRRDVRLRAKERFGSVE